MSASIGFWIERGSMRMWRSCVGRFTPSVWGGRVWPRSLFRLLLIGYFEGLDSERAMAWLTGRFVFASSIFGFGVGGCTPRTFDNGARAEVDRFADAPRVFTWMPKQLAGADLVRGKTPSRSSRSP
jgi:transposase